MTSENSTPASSVIDDVFGENLRQWRELRGLTQEALNTEMTKRGFEFHPTTIYRMEKGRRRVLIGEAVTLAEILQVPLDHLTTPNEDSEAAILFQIQKFARTQLEDISRAIAYLESASPVSGVIDALLESLPDKEKVHTFGETKATAAEFYKALSKANLAETVEQLDKVAKEARPIVSYLVK